MYMEKDGERIEIARSSDVPQDPVSSEVHVPQNTWTLDVSQLQSMLDGCHPACTLVCIRQLVLLLPVVLSAIPPGAVIA